MSRKIFSRIRTSKSLILMMAVLSSPALCAPQSFGEHPQQMANHDVKVRIRGFGGVLDKGAFAQWLVDHPGTILTPQQYGSLQIMQKAGRLQSTAAIFRRADMDRSGKISAPELSILAQDVQPSLDADRSMWVSGA